MLDFLDLHRLMSFRPENLVHDSQHSARCSTPDFSLGILP